MPTEKKRWTLLTAREVLAEFVPAHGWHTLVEAKKRVDGFTGGCDCGFKFLIPNGLIVSHGYTLEEVAYGLRNVPDTTVKS